MKLSLLERLFYITRDRSLYYVSKESGIPYSTLWRFVNQLRDLPERYENSLKNVYSRTVYDNLRNLGFSSYQANRFRWYAPSSVIEREDIFKERLDFYTQGIIATKLKKSAYYYTEDEIKSIYENEIEKLKEGFRKSKKTYEQWISY